MRMNKRLKQPTHMALVFTLGLLAACGSPVLNPVTGQMERSVMTQSDEIAQGQRAHQEVIKQYGVYDNPALQAYVNALGQRLAAQSHRTQLQWHFTVLDSPEINAFALPGGYVYVTRGILAYLDSEADLAGVIGHEIGHVTARHGAQRATSQQNAGLGVLAAQIFGVVLESQGVGGAAQAAGQVSQQVAAGYIASYGREQELQADALGAEYLARNHYNPRNMVNVIQVLKNQEIFAADMAKAQGRAAPPKPNWLASHPSNDQRLEAITQLATQYRSEGAYQDEGRAAYLQTLQGVTFGDSASQGLVRGQQFYHPTLGIALTAPAGWRLQNSAEQLAVLSPNADALLRMQLFTVPVASNQADSLRSALKPTQARMETLTINGLQATRLTGMRQNEQGTAPIAATLIKGPHEHSYLLQRKAQNAQILQELSPQLRETEESFRAMNDKDRKAAKVWALKMTRYPGGGFAELSKNSPLGQPEQQLRLINGFYAGGAPKVGSLVKVVE